MHPFLQYPFHVLLLHKLPVESALIAQTSICARFHWYVSVSKFGLLKSSESLELCPFVVLSCFLLFVVSFRRISYLSPEPSISVLAERNDKAGDNFPTKTKLGLRRLSGNSYNYLSRILLHAIAVYWYLQVIALKGKRSSFFLFSFS